MSVSNTVNTSLSSATTAEAVTKSDTTEYAVPSRAVYVGGAGDLAVRMAGGGSVTFVGVPAGVTLPICVNQVLSTGTSATSILLLR